MPIYFLLSIWVLLSVGSEPTPQAYFERRALFYNALTADKPEPLKMANSCEKRLSPEARPAGLSRPECRTDPGWGQLSHTLPQGTGVWLTATTTHSNLGLFQSGLDVMWDLAVHDLAILDHIWKSTPVAVSATGRKGFTEDSILASPSWQ